MNLDFVYNDLITDRKVFEKSYEFVLNQDIIVPDSKPDILQILHKNSDVCIERYDLENNRLKINGILYVDIMYMADNEKSEIRGLNTEIELNQSIDIPEEYRESIAQVLSTVDSLECKITNERKISVAAKVDCKAILRSNENINYIEDIRNDNDDIQVLNSRLKVSKLLGNEMQNISISEEVSVNDNDILEILESSVKIVNEEYKLSYNKVLVKADAVINVLYVTENNTIATQEIVLPFTGFIDMSNVGDNSIIDVMYNIKSRSIKLNDNKEDRKVSVNMEIQANIKNLENAEITVIEDMYSLTRGIGFDKYNINNDMLVDLNHVLYEIKESISLDEFDCSVIGITSKIARNEIQRVNDKLHIEGDIHLELMCKDTNKIFVKSYLVPYTYIYDNSKIKTCNAYNVDARVKNVTFSVSNNKVDICAQLNFKVSIKNKMEFNLVTNIREEDNVVSCPYSITIYYVKPNDSLWSIAKKFGTTIDEIAKYNDIDNPYDTILQVGRQLFIPQKIVKSVV